LKIYQYIREHGGFDNWSMEELFITSVVSKGDLLKLEREYFEKLKPTLNQNLPYKTPEEKMQFHRQYYQKYYHTHIEYKNRQLQLKREKYQLKKTQGNFVSSDPT
jgi:hypothetical protein